MSKKYLLTVIFISIASLFFYRQFVYSRQSPPFEIFKDRDYVPDEFIVIFSENLVKSDSHYRLERLDNRIEVLNRKFENKMRRIETDSDNAYLIKVKSPTNLKGIMKQYLESGLVEYIIPNYYFYPLQAKEIPNDPEYLEYINNTQKYDAPNYLKGSQWHINRVMAPEAWYIEKGISKSQIDTPITIAILDSGVNQHIDLKSKLLQGWDFIDGDADTTPKPLHEHGTKVAGVTAADTNNGQGVAGICWGCKILPIRIISKHLDVAHLAEAIRYAADHGARIINMSFGKDWGEFDGQESFIQNAISNAHANKIVLVAASGNTGDNIKYPCSDLNVLCVGGSGKDDKRYVGPLLGYPFISCFGTELDVVAPSISITTTIDTAGYTKSEDFDFAGTSAAAPIVSGIAGLLLSRNDDLTPEQIQYLIQLGADDVGTPGRDDYHGWGRVNAYRALQPIVSVEYPQHTFFPKNDGSVYFSVTIIGGRCFKI